MDARTAVLNHSLAKYTRLLEYSPDVARSLYEASRPSTQPAWYTLDRHGNIIVNEAGIREWATSRDFDKYQLAYYTDQVLSPADHREVIEQELGLTQHLCIEQPNPWLDALDPVPEQTLPTWAAYVPTFMTQRVMQYPVVAHTAASSISGQIERDILVLPPTVREALISSVTHTLPNLTTIGGTVPYPLGPLLGWWMKKNKEHHGAIIALALAFYQSQPTDPDPSEQLVWASRCGYMAYTAYAHELLRVYPHLILIMRDGRTLEQIQMESTWLSETLQSVSQHPGYQGAQAPTFDWHIVVTPDLLDAAGVDVEALGQQGMLRHLINSADYPDLLPHVIDQLPTYRLLGVTYIASPTELLLTHKDQCAYQRLPRGMSHKEHPVDLDCEYPQGDPYRTLKCTSPVRHIVLQELGEISMNPQFHGQAPVYATPYGMNAPAMPMPAPTHSRMKLMVPAVYLMNSQMPVPPAHLEQAAQNQQIWAAQGQYLECIAPGNRRIQVILQEFEFTPQGPALSVVAVNPMEDANLRNMLGGQGMQLVDVPGALLPNVPANGAPPQMFGAPGQQMPGMFGSTVMQQPQAAPQQVQFGLPSTAPTTLQALMNSPNGTTMDFDGYRYTRSDRYREGFRRDKLDAPAIPAAAVTPLAKPLAPPAVTPPTAPVNTTPTDRATALIAEIMSQELEFVSSNNGQADPVVYRRGDQTVKLSQALADPGYYRQTHTGIVFTAMARSVQSQRWQEYFGRMRQLSDAPPAAPAVQQPAPTPQPAAPRGDSAAIDKIVQAIQKGHKVTTAPQPTPPAEESTLDDPDDNFSITDDGVDKIAAAVVKQVVAEPLAAPVAPPAKPASTHREVPLVQTRRKRWAIALPAARRSTTLVIRVREDDTPVAIAEVALKEGESPVSYSAVDDLLHDEGRENVEKILDAQTERGESSTACGVNLKLEFRLTNAETGELVTDDELAQKSSVCETVGELREIYDAEGTVATVTAAVVEDPEHPTPMVESLQEMAATMILDVPDSQGSVVVPAAYAHAFTLGQVQGQPAIAVIASQLREEGVEDAAGFIKAYREASNTEHTQEAMLTCGNITSPLYNAVMLRSAYEELNTVLTRRFNYVFKHALGIDLRLTSYVKQREQIPGIFKEHYNQNGLANCWPELENQVVLSVLSNLIHVQPTEDEYKNTVLIDNVNMIRLACTLDDLDIALIPGADACAQPVRPSTLLTSVLAAIEKEYMPQLEFCAPHAPTLIVRHVLATLDGHYITVYPHPAGITTNAGDIVWMLTLQE